MRLTLLLVAVLALGAADEDTVERRVAACTALARPEGNAASAVARLIAALEDPYYDVRREAVRSLGILGAAAVPALGKALDGGYFLRCGAASALAGMGASAGETAPALVRLLGSDEMADPFLRTQVCSALAAIGTPAALAMPTVLAALDPAQRRPGDEHLFTWLGSLGREGAPALPLLLGLLSDHGDQHVARRTLAGMGEVALTPLLERLRGPQGQEDHRFIANALDLIAAWGEASAPAVDDLHRRLIDGHIERRLAVVRALGCIGAPARTAVPRLAWLATHPSRAPAPASAVRSAAELRRLAAESPAAAADGTRPAEPLLRRWAAWALGAIAAADDAQAGAALAACAADPDPGLATTAREALARWRDPAAPPPGEPPRHAAASAEATPADAPACVEP